MKPELVNLFGCLFLSVLFLALPCLGNETDASAKITAIAAKRLNEGETAKFWVSFTDKGKDAEKILQQKAQLLDQEDPWGAIFARFEPRALERRKKVLKERELLDVDDLDVHEKYIEAVISVDGVSLVSRSRWLNAISVSIDLSQNPSALLDIAALPFVSEIDRVHSYKRKLPNTPITENQKRDASLSRFSRNEPTDEELAFYGDSYDQLDQINVIALHKRNFTGKGVLVLMIDSGFNKDIPSFQKKRLVDEHDFINDDDDVSHQNGDYETQETHGTATTSCVGGYDPGYLIGAAYEVDFLLAKTEITEEEIQVEEDYWVEAIEWGEKKGADLVSSSLGYSLWWHYSDCTGKASKASLAADKASQKGVLVVISAGNDRAENGFISIPGDAEYALTVGAVTNAGDVVYFSSQGPTFDGRIKPDVAALGYHDHVAATDGAYTTMSGTSFAAPLTAGACALLIQAHPDWTPFQIRTAMRMTASINDNPNTDLGWGIINAEAACDFDQEAFQISSKPLSHGNCTDDNNCECETGFYGSYCLYPLVECASFCTGGLCFGEECTCDTQWEGKRCDLEKFVLVVPGLGSEIVTVVLLCFSILMLLFVLLFFFCIVRP